MIKNPTVFDGPGKRYFLKSEKQMPFKKLNSVERPAVAIEILKSENTTPYNRMMKFLDKGSTIFQIAFKRGAYVADGMARMLMSENRIRHSSNFIEENGILEIAYSKISDVDFFFKTEEDFNKAKEEVLAFSSNHEEFVKCEMSIAGFALNITVEANDLLRKSADLNPEIEIQFIACRFGDVEDVLSRFDIRNSMVAFDQNHVWKAAKWDEIESENSLDVVQWNPLTLWRINKYIRKYGFDNLTDFTRQNFIDGVTKTVKMLRPMQDDITIKQRGTFENGVLKDPHHGQLISAIYKFVLSYSEKLHIDDETKLFLITICNAISKNTDRLDIFGEIKTYLNGNLSVLSNNSRAQFDIEVLDLVEKFNSTSHFLEKHYG